MNDTAEQLAAKKAAIDADLLVLGAELQTPEYEALPRNYREFLLYQYHWMSAVSSVLSDRIKFGLHS